MKMSILQVLAQKFSNIRSLLDRPHMPSPRSRQALSVVKKFSESYTHTGKCIRRFGGIYAYCRYFADRKW